MFRAIVKVDAALPPHRPPRSGHCRSHQSRWVKPFAYRGHGFPMTPLIPSALPSAALTASSPLSSMEPARPLTSISPTPRHFLGGRMDAEEATDAVPDGGDPPRTPCPTARRQAAECPCHKPTYKVATHLCKLGDALAQGIDQACDYPRHRLDDLHDDGGQIFDEGSQ